MIFRCLKHLKLSTCHLSPVIPQTRPVQHRNISPKLYLRPRVLLSTGALSSLFKSGTHLINRTLSSHLTTNCHRKNFTTYQINFVIFGSNTMLQNPVRTCCFPLHASSSTTTEFLEDTDKNAHLKLWGTLKCQRVRWLFGSCSSQTHKRSNMETDGELMSQCHLVPFSPLKSFSKSPSGQQTFQGTL